MEAIEHKYVEVNGLKIHIAETGSGNSPVVVFLHGFPEIWYSWRYQMIAVAKAGYRAIAPDFRGYGLSDQPPQPEKTTYLDLVNDLLALLDALSISKEPGRAEADFGRIDAKRVVRNVYILFSRSEIPIANENQEIMDIVQPSTPLPPWFSEEDLDAYGALYEKSGFQTALQVPYRSLHEQANITDPRVHVPALFIAGEKDYFLKFPGVEDYISGGLKSLVRNLQMVNLPEGTHFVQEQLPDEVNRLMLDFLTRNSQS
ncbi:uncharacterized protein LOC132045553 isoform X2 [Lycium ferocissimum]|uniref:uncharacterized protein LOC132045553 isoform X2 n=1 Tax=Lycium ferocissimum TaxID=112874 RepID=UPI002814EF5E|nr:uncharacterized protein LOC132045553 isoform X2 [Lycium ferocissimum]